VNVNVATKEVEIALSQAEPAASGEFARNADAFRRQVSRIDRRIARCFDSLPTDQRKLVTDHDALAYFADRYGIEVVGAVIPALTTEAQPSAGDLAELERMIEREGVRAIFPESSYSPKLAEAVAGDTGATIEYSLYGDALGPEGSGAETWAGMIKANADAMMRGFTGGARGCDFD
jgi:ABC-type Zn uptake system ZnuABC Zn-binding protein ZnuA